MTVHAHDYVETGQPLDRFTVSPSPCGLFLDILSRKVLKKGTAHPLRCAKTQVNGFCQIRTALPGAG